MTVVALIRTSIDKNCVKLSQSTECPAVSFQPDLGVFVSCWCVNISVTVCLQTLVHFHSLQRPKLTKINDKVMKVESCYFQARYTNI